MPVSFWIFHGETKTESYRYFTEISYLAHCTVIRTSCFRWQASHSNAEIFERTRPFVFAAVWSLPWRGAVAHFPANKARDIRQEQNKSINKNNHPFGCGWNKRCHTMQSSISDLWYIFSDDLIVAECSYDNLLLARCWTVREIWLESKLNWIFS